MSKLTHSLLLAMVCLLLGLPAAATHIVGGDLTYKYINDTTYEVTLVLYVDCINGDPGAILQDTYAAIGVFGNDDKLQEYFYMEHTGPTRIDDTKYLCVKPPSNACVDRYVYVREVYLPLSAEDRRLVFQRCCRNWTINNIVNAEYTGATYIVKLPGTATIDSNSSAVFNNLPPNFLCEDELLVFDHSATDPDGDQLVYSFYEPYTGATPNAPRPVPPNSPPYLPVVWQGPYTAKDPMGSESVLTIDSLTGELRMVPADTGQFVIGVSVKEYRNGKLVGETLRDYQFNILPCKAAVVADFKIPDIYCTNELQVFNNSIGENATYFWDFGVGDIASDTSNEYEPTYSYTKNGEYTITLAVKVKQCTDTLRKKITILDPSLDKSARPDTTICFGDSVQLGAEHSRNYTYMWEPSEGLSSATVANPSAWPKERTTYLVTKSYQNCSFTDKVTIDVIRPVPDFSYEVTYQCELVKVDFKNTSPYADSVKWYFNGKPFSGQDEVTHYFPYNTIAKGSIEALVGSCSQSKEIKIEMPTFKDMGLFIPNVMTPNGDGFNDCFEPEYRNLPVLCPPKELQIYNRWGELVYDYADTQEFCWDGNDRKSGKPLPSGTYYFILKVIEGEFKGTVTLLR